MNTQSQEIKTANKKVTLIYVMDPHCGWCYGFGGVIEQLYEHYKKNDNVKFEVLPGGLFVPGFMGSKEFADSKRPIIKRIEELSGEKFSEDYTSKVLGAGLLDSEVPCRIINTANKLNPKQIVSFMEDLLRENYVKAHNLSFFETAIPIIEKYGMNVEAFKTLFNSDEMKKATQENFAKSHQLTSGYPALFVEEQNGTITKLASGYAPFDRVQNKIDELLK